MKIYHCVDEIDVRSDVWQTLQAAKKPIVLYGMGNGADKILAEFEKRGIEAADFFASDGFVRHQQFHGKTVLSYGEICEKYEDFIVVVCFGSSLSDVIANIEHISGERELYMPDVPVVSESALFDLPFFEKHRSELQSACELFADEQSKQVFCDVLLYRLTGKIAYLRRHETTPAEAMALINAQTVRKCADLGAYNGDSIRSLAAYAPSLARVIAFEPDARTFKKLSAYAQDAPFQIEAHNLAAWDKEETLSFTSGGNRNSTLISADGIKAGAKVKPVQAARLDYVYKGDCDYIKYDVEGAEWEALLGSKETISRAHPRLLVSMYHRNEDLYKLPMLVKKMGYGRLYLRRYEYLPAWDLNLLAIWG